MALAILSLLIYGCGDDGGKTTAGTSATTDGSAEIPEGSLILYQNAPATYQELPKVTVAELKAMIDSGAKDFLVVDVNPMSMYNTGHIPGAIHLQWSPTGLSADPNLPRDILLIFYCTCEAEEDSGLMGLSAVTKYGYRNIKLLLGGNPAWKAAGYTFDKG